MRRCAISNSPSPLRNGRDDLRRSATHQKPECHGDPRGKKAKCDLSHCLHGTPVENTLVDLWCLFDFIQPGLLGALNDFGRRYRRPIEAKTDEEICRVEELRKRIEPQILRRTKADVAKDLPPKNEIPSRVALSDYQRALYANAIDLFKRRDDPEARSPFKNHLGLLHYLRLICTDPRRMGLSVFRPSHSTNTNVARRNSRGF